MGGLGSRGDGCVLGATDTTRCCGPRFNVAAVFQLRKSSGLLLPDIKKALAASMWPQSFNCGNLSRPAERRGSVSHASMWPQSFNCGNLCWNSKTPAPLTGFNVAAVFQLRKSFEKLPLHIEIVLLQCGRSLSTAEIADIAEGITEGLCRFNVAAVFQLRKSASFCHVQRGPVYASMWPQSFNCGNVAGGRFILNVYNSFNVAAVFQLRKWTCQTPLLALTAPASMWPQSFNCGNSLTGVLILLTTIPLQCGRSLSTAEIRI